MEVSDNKRLEKIDELYRLHLDQHIALPQLIVVGDQSSGKSSVLEALSDGLPFLRDSGLCTRFPTQIVFKRSPATKIEVSVISAQGDLSSSKFGKKRLETLDNTQFLSIMFEACECMGLPRPGEQSQGKASFSLDMLKIELSGPRYEHFSVIDLPGLFRKATPGQTTVEDIALVRKMITKFMENPRSIMLAVVPANVDIATQEIVHMAEQADPKRKRTLGVLTKPDLVDAGAEDKVLQLLQPDSSNLGYVVVRNRSQKDQTMNIAERFANEVNFFDSDPWNKVPRDRTGISALKKLCNKLLKDITRKSFNRVVYEIDIKLDDHSEELKKIGPARSDPATQRMFLLQLAADYQAQINKAVYSSHGHGNCFQDSEMPLTSLIIITSEKFAETMSRKSFTRAFRNDYPSDSDGLNSPWSPRNPEQNNDKDVGSGVNSSAKGVNNAEDDDASDSEELDNYKAVSRFPELRFLGTTQSARPRYSREDISTWIKREFQNYRSLSIGGLNPALYQALFKEQTAPWVVLAGSYVGETIVNVHRFLRKLLEHVCKDSSALEGIWTRMIPNLVESYSRATNHLAFLLQAERDGNLGTLNHYLTENIKKSTEARTLHRLRGLGSHTTGNDSSQPLLRLSDVTKFYQSNEDHDVEDVHDTLKSYCKLVRKRFVDNVYMQVVNHLLLTSDKSPLRIFSPAWVGSLSDADLADIAGETESIKQRRKVLLEEIESFQQGLKILRG